MGWRELRKAIADDKSDTATYSDEFSSVEVLQQRKGFMCTVKARGKVHLEPEKVFDILVSPETDKVFSGIKRVDYRKTLEDDGDGRQKIEVQQVGQWKFLGFSGQFTTTLYVSQDRKARTIDFRLAKPGLMKDFAGQWKIRPLNEQSSNPSSASRVGPPGFLGISAFAPKAQSSLITFEQSIMPSFVPPKPLDRVLKGISSRQVQVILQDLQNEVERQTRHSGTSEDGTESGVVQLSSKEKRSAPGPFDYGS